jgi:hypothetical protein
MRMSGRCLCGSLSYDADAEPALVCVCHCKDCQRQGGSAFGTLVIIPRDTFEMRGEFRTHTQPGGSGQPMRRHFCPGCGSPVAIDAAAAPGMVLLTAGTLDETSFVAPTRNIFCSQAQAWVPITRDTQNYPLGPA